MENLEDIVTILRDHQEYIDQQIVVIRLEYVANEPKNP